MKTIRINFMIIMLLSSVAALSQIYKADAVKVDFFSSAPIEDIHAVSNKGLSVLKAKTGEIAFRINTRSFDFAKGKMQEHFNENFLESHKYPASEFKGELQQEVDLSRDGIYDVVLEGILEIHGVKQKRIIPARLKVKNNQITLESEFEVACEDHNIKIPQILWQNIAEVVKVTVQSNYIKM